MRRFLLVLLVTAAMAEPALAQATDTVVVGTRHSPVASGLLEFVFPTAGFAYAGDWTRGFLPNALRIGTAIGFGVTGDGPEDDVCEGEGACQVWAIAFLSATVWSIVGAVQTANDHNRDISELESSLYVAPSPVGGVSVGFRLTR